MKTKISLIFIMCWLGNAHAATSTLRVSCEDQATGAEVSINGKFKGECPIDIQVNEGKLHLKAVKIIAGKNNVFEQEIKIGDGVTKRIEVLFGIAKEASATIQVDQHAVAQQRYEAELEEYNRSIQSCLPKYEVEKRRLTQALKVAFKAHWDDCVSRLSYSISQSMDAYGQTRAQASKNVCGESEYGDMETYKGDEYDALSNFRLQSNNNADKWCASQFTRPREP